MIKLTRIGIDLAKNVFQLHGVDQSGNCVFKRRLSRSQWLDVLCKLWTVLRDKLECAVDCALW